MNVKHTALKNEKLVSNRTRRKSTKKESNHESKFFGKKGIRISNPNSLGKNDSNHESLLMEDFEGRNRVEGVEFPPIKHVN